jgi:hypothetical protein
MYSVEPRPVVQMAHQFGGFFDGERFAFECGRCMWFLCVMKESAEMTDTTPRYRAVMGFAALDCLSGLPKVSS